MELLISFRKHIVIQFPEGNVVNSHIDSWLVLLTRNLSKSLDKGIFGSRLSFLLFCPEIYLPSNIAP